MELGSSLDLMRQRIEQLENECEYYKSQGAGAGKEEAMYYLELIRNNYLELESLSSEIGLESERMALLAERIV